MLFLRNGQLLWKQTYDGTLQCSIEDDRLVETVRAVTDFMADTFSQYQNQADDQSRDTTSFVIGSYYVIGITEGPYQLIALAQAGVSEQLIGVWMRQVLQNLRTQFKEG